MKSVDVFMEASFVFQLMHNCVILEEDNCVILEEDNYALPIGSNASSNKPLSLE